MLIAIDPGNIYTAWVRMDGYKPVQFAKELNGQVLSRLKAQPPETKIVIENIANYGMPVGRQVFDTCIWIGRFLEAVGGRAEYIFRKDEKLTICGTMKANDTNIRHALIDRFAEHDFRTGKGTAKNKDFFFGFYADVWQAFAVGVTWLDKRQYSTPIRNAPKTRSKAPVSVSTAKVDKE